jgi:hypothetical protein
LGFQGWGLGFLVAGGHFAGSGKGGEGGGWGGGGGRGGLGAYAGGCRWVRGWGG